MVIFSWRFDFSKKRRYNKGCFIFLYLLFVFISGFRYRLGVDSVMYEDDFSLYPPLSSYKWGYEYVRDAKDVFWAILNSACRTFTDSFVLVQVVMAFFVNGVMFWFVKRHSSMPFLAILLYFFTLWPLLTFEALREAMSVSFFIFALDALIGKRSYTKYYIRVWPAFFFHTFGFMTLLFPLITFVKPSKLTYFLTFMVGFVTLYAGYLVSDTILPYISGESLAEEKMTMYLESDMYGTSIWSIGGILAIILGYVIPIVIMIYVLSKSNEKSIRWVIPFLMFMLIISLFKISLPLVYRFFNYFYIVLIVAMTECLKHSEKSLRRYKLSLVSVILFVFMVLYGLSKPAGGSKYPAIYRYYPYNSIFTKDVNKETEASLPL